MPFTFGTRPTALRIASQSRVRVPLWSLIDTFLLRPSCDNPTTAVFVQICTPSRCRESLTMADASGSSRGNTRSERSTCVTWEPSWAKAWASSHPIGPPPTTTIRCGNSVRENTVSFVRTSVCSEPAMSILAGRAPLAITALLKLSVALSTLT